MTFCDSRRGAIGAGGRTGARWLTVALGVTVLLSAAPQAGPPQDDRQVSVTSKDGVYSVVASFAVPAAASIVRDTLTDYGQIPRFMPEMRSSHVLERVANRVVVEQEAVARFLMFSKRIHLVLDVEEAPLSIHFRDRCGTSFTRYVGSWSLAEGDGQTLVTYLLSSKPAFDVPGFLLRRLLERDANEMIERLTGEIAARARRN